MDTIRYRISRRDLVFSKRILLTAIAKGNDQIREQILSQLKPETLSTRTISVNLSNKEKKELT